MNEQLLNKKIELIQWLSTLDDNSIIEKLIQLKNEEVKDWWNLTSEEEKASIEKGKAEAEQNQLEPHSAARKLYEKWL